MAFHYSLYEKYIKTTFSQRDIWTQKADKMHQQRERSFPQLVRRGVLLCCPITSSHQPQTEASWTRTRTFRQERPRAGGGRPSQTPLTWIHDPHWVWLHSTELGEIINKIIPYSYAINPGFVRGEPVLERRERITVVSYIYWTIYVTEGFDSFFWKMISLNDL